MIIIDKYKDKYKNIIFYEKEINQKDNEITLYILKKLKEKSLLNYKNNILYEIKLTKNRLNIEYNEIDFQYLQYLLNLYYKNFN